jgi:hypothetical protein
MRGTEGLPVAVEAGKQTHKSAISPNYPTFDEKFGHPLNWRLMGGFAGIPQSSRS